VRTNARAWAAAGVLSIAVLAALIWRFVATTNPATHEESRTATSARPQIPREVPAISADPGNVSAGAGAVRTVRWELAFPQGVWSLDFAVGSPNVALRFLDLSGAVSADCHTLSAVTERGPAPFPVAGFVELTHTAELADMPIEVVEALTRARELTLVACDTRFALDDAQQRVLINFYVQATGAILDALSADGGAAANPPGGSDGTAP
jgi:hypothetical protein